MGKQTQCGMKTFIAVTGLVSCFIGLKLYCWYSCFPLTQQLFLIGSNSTNEYETMIRSSSAQVQELHVATPTSMIPAMQVHEVIHKRNQISRQLNSLQEKYLQLQCKTRKDVSETGGWCLINSTKGHITDLKVAEALSKFLENKTVGSFGDGYGKYKEYILQTGRVAGYDAYDGAPFSFQITKGQVQFLDLTLEHYGLPAYDWVVSLEVIEHIPAEFEQTVLSNLARHAREGLVMSWAVEGQKGFHHVNCRNLDYVVKVLHDIGFKHDVDSSKKLQTAAKIAWLQKNINVFRRMAGVPFDESKV